MKPARRPARYDDLLAVPDTKVAEIIDGELIVSPRPALSHCLAASHMARDLSFAFSRPPGGSEAPGGWWLLNEPELRFDADVLVPDQAGWRRERLPVVPREAAMTLAPDWICEVISPSTGRIDRGRKMRIYGREGVAWLWLVDPILRAIETYALVDWEWVVKTVHTSDAPVRLPPFEAVELDVTQWWMESAS